MIKLPKEREIEGYHLDNLRMLIYGWPGIGKSTFASGFDNCIFVCTEKAHKHLKIYKTEIHNWKEFLEVVEKLLGESHKYRVVIIDTIDNLFKFCTIHVCQKYKIDHPSDSKWGKGWDLLQKEFEKPILDLSMSDFGIVFISQAKEVEIKKRHSAFTKVTSTLSNQARKIILPFVDVIGFCTAEDEGKSGQERRVMTFEPSEYVEAKDRTGFLPKKIPLRFWAFKKYFENESEE